MIRYISKYGVAVDEYIFKIPGRVRSETNTGREIKLSEKAALHLKGQLCVKSKLN